MTANPHRHGPADGNDLTEEMNRLYGEDVGNYQDADGTYSVRAIDANAWEVELPGAGYYGDVYTRERGVLYSPHRVFSEVIGPDTVTYCGLARALHRLTARASNLGGDLEIAVLRDPDRAALAIVEDRSAAIAAARLAEHGQLPDRYTVATYPDWFAAVRTLTVTERCTVAHLEPEQAADETWWRIG